MDRRSFFASCSAVIAAPLAAFGLESQQKPSVVTPWHVLRPGQLIPDPACITVARYFSNAKAVPRGGLFLTASVDVGKDWLEVEVLAWGRGRKSWSITHKLLQPTAIASEWQSLEALLLLDWPCSDGGTMPIWCMFIDSGYRAQEVYDFFRCYPDYPECYKSPGGPVRVSSPRTVIPIKGGLSISKPIESISLIDAGRQRILTVGMPWLRLSLGIKACLAPRDLTCYNLAAAELCGIGRFTERDWLELEARKAFNPRNGNGLRYGRGSAWGPV